jgi:hypothetical protein
VTGLLATSQVAPTSFEWWSGIVLPTVFGIGSLALSGAALLIARIALRDSRRAEQRAGRQVRVAESEVLNRLVAGTAQAITNNAPMSAMVDVIQAQNQFALSNRHGPRSIAAQLLYWLSYVEEHEPDRHDRLRIVIDILSYPQTGIQTYIEDSSETWTLPVRSIDDALAARDRN